MSRSALMRCDRIVGCADDAGTRAEVGSPFAMASAGCVRVGHRLGAGPAEHLHVVVVVPTLQAESGLLDRLVTRLGEVP